MPRYSFSLSNHDGVHEIGVVSCPTFAEALDRLAEHESLHDGDILEIGVTGFPPARYESVFSFDDLVPQWKPVGVSQRAA